MEPQSHMRTLPGYPVGFFTSLKTFAANRIGRSNRLGNRSSCTDERSVSCLSSRLGVLVSSRDTSRLPLPIEGAILRKKVPRLATKEHVSPWLAAKRRSLLFGHLGLPHTEIPDGAQKKPNLAVRLSWIVFWHQQIIRPCPFPSAASSVRR